LLSNYVLDDDNSIFCIDNDVSFVEPLVDWKIYFCSALFCLNTERALHRKVLEEFCVLDAEAILNGWIEDVIEKEKAYLSLFSDQEQKTLYTENASNQFKATILFREGSLATLNVQFCKLQNYLTSMLYQNKAVTALDLLKQIISLGQNPALESVSGSYL